MVLQRLRELFTLKENRIFVVLLLWLIGGYIALNVFDLIGLPIVGIVIYFPLLSFTIFLLILNIFKFKLREKTTKQLVLIFIISIPVMLILFYILIILFIFSIISYIAFTSIFLLYNCYNLGTKIDEKLYYKKGAWLLRGLEFWVGFFISAIILLITGSILKELLLIYAPEAETVLSSVFVMLLVIIAFLTFINIIFLLSKRFNAWLGIFFLFISFYAIYLVTKVFVQVIGIDISASYDPITYIAMMIFDIFLIVLSVSTILLRTEALDKKLKVISADSLLLWLIFSKGTWEFINNFPVNLLIYIPNSESLIEQINSFSLMTNLLVMLLFVWLVLIGGVIGILKYFKRKKEMKLVKQDMNA